MLLKKPYLTFTVALLVLQACKQVPNRPHFSKAGGADFAQGSGDSQQEYEGTPGSGPTPSPIPVNGTSPTGTTPAPPVNPATPTSPSPTPAPATTSVAPCTSVNWAAIKKPEDFLCLGSREKIFENFPEWLKPYFTLMHSTKSAQVATLENPRIIVTSPEGSYIFGVSTDPAAQPDIEIAVYDYTNEVWQFAGVDFSTNPPKVEKELCKNCHGQVLHTNWGSYKRWDGAYGQPDLRVNQAEINMLEKFRQKGPGVHPLLKALKYKASYTGNQAVMNAASGRVETETNEMMGIVMAVKASRSLAARVLKPGAVTKPQLSNILYETLCTNYSTFGAPVTVPSLTAVNLPSETYLAHLPPQSGGGNSKSILFVGFDSTVYWFGLTLLERVMAQDPTLKTMLPEAAAMFASPRYRVVFTPITGDFLALANQVQTAWVSTRDEVNQRVTKIFPKGGSSPSCEKLKTYMK